VILTGGLWSAYSKARKFKRKRKIKRIFKIKSRKHRESGYQSVKSSYGKHNLWSVWCKCGGVHGRLSLSESERLITEIAARSSYKLSTRYRSPRQLCSN